MNWNENSLKHGSLSSVVCHHFVLLTNLIHSFKLSPSRFTSLVHYFIASCAWVMIWFLVRGTYSELGAWNNFLFYSLPLILFLNESLLNLLGITHQFQYYTSLQKKKPIFYKFNSWVTSSLPHYHLHPNFMTILWIFIFFFNSRFTFIAQHNQTSQLEIF